MIRTFHFELLFKDTCIYGFSFWFFLFSNRAMAMVQPAKCARYTSQGTLLVAEMPLSLATHRVGMARVDSSARLEGGDCSLVSHCLVPHGLSSLERLELHTIELCALARSVLFRANGACSLVLPHLCPTE